MRKLRLNKTQMEEIEERRKAVKMTQKEMSRKIGVTERCYRLYVRDGASTIRLFAMKNALAEAERNHSAS